MIFWRIMQDFWRKEKGSDGKPGKWETAQKRRRRDDNIDNKPVASIIFSIVGNIFLRVLGMGLCGYPIFL